MCRRKQSKTGSPEADHSCMSRCPRSSQRDSSMRADRLCLTSLVRFRERTVRVFDRSSPSASSTRRARTSGCATRRRQTCGEPLAEGLTAHGRQRGEHAFPLTCRASAVAVPPAWPVLREYFGTRVGLLWECGSGTRRRLCDGFPPRRSGPFARALRAPSLRPGSRAS